MARCTVFAFTLEGNATKVFFDEDWVEEGCLEAGVPVRVLRSKDTFTIRIGSGPVGIPGTIMAIEEKLITLNPPHDVSEREAHIVHLALEVASESLH